MILVTGATGHYGTETINFLLRTGTRATDISALVRDEAKAEALKEKGITLKRGDYNDYNTLVSAFRGVDKLLFISGADPAQRSVQHENIVRAAKESGVKYIVYTSIDRRNEKEDSPIAFITQTHLLTEKLIKESGIPYTILRNNIYLEMLPIFLGQKILETGVYFPAGEGRIAFALRTDMAEATAKILSQAGHENKVYKISNTENVSFSNISDSLTEITGKKINYVSPGASAYTESMLGAGVPKGYIDMFFAFGEGMRQEEFTATASDLEEILGRKPTTAREYLATVYGSSN